MGAAFLSFINGGNIFEIERAAEIALEHSLGLTCDPIEGYVQIPCIERNAIGANRSMMAYALSKLMGQTNSKITFDMAVKTMYYTGKDLSKRYRETARGGLAKTYEKQAK
jgi:L-serine dehydratase